MTAEGFEPEPVSPNTQGDQISGICGQTEPANETEPASRVQWLLVRSMAGLLLFAHTVGLVLGGVFGSQPRSARPRRALRILLTGTFRSANWITAHILPLSQSSRCANVYVVSTFPIPAIPKTTAVYPPRWLVRIIGAVPARLAVFAWTAIRIRPEIVGGFHLMLNGLLAQVLARFVGARSVYFCVGGPNEIRGGGAHGENRLFRRLGRSDTAIERYLIRSGCGFDLIVTMGTKAADFWRGHQLKGACHVIAGGIDARRFAPTNAPTTTDLILTGRLVPVKRIDVFLRAVRLAAARRASLTAVIIGDGPLRHELEELARGLGCHGHVRFIGHQSNVEPWLRQGRVFVLTSDSEGLALSVMEAMMCGLPAVVSRVGDLSDLVKDGVNGYLVPRRSPEAFADRLIELLNNADRLKAFSCEARRAALEYEVSAVARRWDMCLDNCRA